MNAEERCESLPSKTAIRSMKDNDFTTGVAKSIRLSLPTADALENCSLLARHG
jgi:hypothetical protein